MIIGMNILNQYKMIIDFDKKCVKWSNYEEYFVEGNKEEEGPEKNTDKEINIINFNITRDAENDNLIGENGIKEEMSDTDKYLLQCTVTTSQMLPNSNSLPSSGGRLSSLPTLCWGLMHCLLWSNCEGGIKGIKHQYAAKENSFSSKISYLSKAERYLLQCTVTTSQMLPNSNSLPSSGADCQTYLRCVGVDALLTLE
ncbi:hypothetical protein FQA39_LY10737 [Lamprigera yunnana]|nr:hypothetical protein FQA39_LY10737 [Lamprigera yunnana]